MNAKAAVSLLIIDDNPGSLELLSAALAQPDLEILTASEPEIGLDLIHERRPQIVLTDLVMPHMTGIEVLERTMEFDPSIDVILMTAHYSTESAVEAIKKGASDYLNKPVSISTLRERIGRLVDDARKRHRTLQLQGEMLAAAEFEGLVGHSPLMWDMFSRIRRVAPHYRSVLITGETGTGKDLTAQALHKLSPAKGGRYVVLNCSAVVETLFESELFGHVKGAFTGAVSDKAGLFEHAHGGTLFLDEIGDMPLATQAKLLRVLQNQEVQRVGSLSARKVDVRVIAATNHDLRAAVAEKRFREDLYYRLAMVEIEVPRLAERKEDLPLLERHFISKFAAQYGKTIHGLTHRAQILMSLHRWPGNVRELENVIGHACMMAMSDVIDIPDLPASLRPAKSSLATAATVSLPESNDAGVATFEEQERLLILRALEASGGNQSQAARLLRIGRDALRYKMKKHNVS
jgi:DNA-binding NtrC family response regulator